ncbi:UDP-N-acetylmuramate dehydrogenase [Candidatus Binatia bacterium]|nr:UDP-N-acetylmuramate dehydrogenase [Candidatus Binatia bacterium]
MIPAVSGQPGASHLEGMLPGRVRLHEPLSRHTSFRIGGPADIWIDVVGAADIGTVQAVAGAEGLPLTVVGGGTNILVSDLGVRGIVIHPGRSLVSTEWSECRGGIRVRAGAALALKRLVTEAIERGLAGLEFAEGIPGSVGGGLLMNAGAFGGELSQAITGVEGVDGDGKVVRLSREVLLFQYRRLDLPAGFVITHVEFLLTPGEREAIEARRADAKRRREKHQPLGYPNAGSIFKNPPGLFAGLLLESVGMKGERCGGAMVAVEHANFIVNVGHASAADVRALMAEGARRVWERHGVRLEPEIRLVGEWREV